MCLATLQAELKEAESDFMAAEKAIRKGCQGRSDSDKWQRWESCLNLIAQLRRDIRLVRALEADA